MLSPCDNTVHFEPQTPALTNRPSKDNVLCVSLESVFHSKEGHLAKPGQESLAF